MGNSGLDGMRILDGIPPSAGGTGNVLAEASYNAAAAPFTGGSSGISAERIDLFATMIATAAPAANSSNAAQALSTTTFGTCATDRGTPRTLNGNDVSVWPGTTTYLDAALQNTGTMALRLAPSIGAGLIRFDNAGGPASTPYLLCYANPPAVDIPFSVILPGPYTGSLLVDPFTAAFDDNPAYAFDSSGNHVLLVPTGFNVALVGQTFNVQWISFDSGIPDFVSSNGVTITIVD
jgi:hypothetical protein